MSGWLRTQPVCLVLNSGVEVLSVSSVPLIVTWLPVLLWNPVPSRVGWLDLPQCVPTWSWLVLVALIASTCSPLPCVSVYSERLALSCDSLLCSLRKRGKESQWLHRHLHAIRSVEFLLASTSDNIFFPPLSDFVSPVCVLFRRAIFVMFVNKDFCLDFL